MTDATRRDSGEGTPERTDDGRWRPRFEGECEPPRPLEYTWGFTEEDVAR